MGNEQSRVGENGEIAGMNAGISVGARGAGAPTPDGKPAAVSTMKNEVSRKFAHGATYNMRVIIRGDRNTGKTQLWNRMQGKGFSVAYIPTAQIQTATIDWNHKTTSEVIKVEVWDVVDRGLKGDGSDDFADQSSASTVDEAGLKSVLSTSSSSSGLGSSHSGTGKDSSKGGSKGGPRSGNFTVGTLDATMVDVMRGTSGVIFVFDMTKRWTWEYIQKDLEAASKAGVSVLVVGNFRDMGENRVVSEEEVRTHLAALSKDIWYTEASMKNMFGLKMISRFLSIPFLSIQRQALLARLEKNKLEDTGVHNDFSTLTETSNYAEYVRTLQEKNEAPQGKKPAPQKSKPEKIEPEKSEKSEKSEKVEKKKQQPATTAKTQKKAPVVVKKTVSAEEEKRKQEESIKQLKALSNKKTSGKSVDDFNPGDLDDDDDIFGEAVDDDGWITKEPDDDVWGSALGDSDDDDDEDEEEEVVKVAPKKSVGAQKKKKKQTIILEDEDF